LGSDHKYTGNRSKDRQMILYPTKNILQNTGKNNRVKKQPKEWKKKICQLFITKD
jgi:hypothetical protein